jgi:hypothetical protein
VVDHDSGVQSECCTEVIGSGREMGAQADESDAFLPDQHPGQSDRTVSAAFVACQSRTSCLRVAVVNTGQDRRIGACPLGLTGWIVRSCFHQDDREIGFLRVQASKGEACPETRITGQCHPCI